MSAPPPPWAPATAYRARKTPPLGTPATVELCYVAAFVAVELLGLIDPLITAFGHAIWRGQGCASLRASPT